MAIKKIPKPQMLWKLFNEYEKYIKSHPIKVTKYVGYNKPRLVTLSKERPLTYSGFEMFVCNKGIISTLDHYFYNYQGRYEDYKRVCRMIKTAIKADLICGGMVGIYNSSITARITGLKDKKKTEKHGTVTIKIKRETSGE